MTIREIGSQGLYYARTCRSLWLFGFLVGIASGGGANGGGGAGGKRDAGGAAAGGGLLNLSVTEIALIAIVIILAVAAVIVMRLVGEGAQLLHAAANLVADRSHRLDRPPLRVLEQPVVPLHARHDRALVAAPIVINIEGRQPAPA